MRKCLIKLIMFFSFVDTVDEKKLTEQILALKKERTDALAKMSELQKQVGYKCDRISMSYI